MVFVQNSHSVDPEKTAASVAYSDALSRGADHACKQHQRATKRLANMIQAQCVANDIRAGTDAIDSSRHCFGAHQRSGYVRAAEEICGNI
jgi:hypothetical protein